MSREQLIAEAKQKHRQELVAQARAQYQAQQQAPQAPPQEEGSSLWDTAKSVGGTALDYGLRGLDYAGGLARTGVASHLANSGGSGDLMRGAAMAGMPEEDIPRPGVGQVSYEDWLAAMRGQAPTSSEYMERMDIPEGGSVGVPLLGDVSARGAAGFASDVLLDPLTYATFGASALAKTGKAGKVASKALTAGSDAFKATGKKMYKSGFKKVDEGLVEKGMKPLSDVLWENNRIAGTNRTINKKANKLNEKLLKERQGYYNIINEAGEAVDIMPAIETALARGKDITRRSPGKADTVSKMDDWLLHYMNQGERVPVELMSEWKTGLYQSLPDSAYNAFGKALPAQGDYQKAFARGMKESIETAGERAAPGVGKAISSVNEDIGSLIQAKKPLAREVRKANTKNAVSSVDAALAGYGAFNPVSLAALGTKKIADLGNTTVFRTQGGKFIDSMGRTLAPDILGRQMLIEANRPNDPSPWDGMLGN